MNRLEKAKIKKLKRAALITANSKGYRTGFEGYKIYDYGLFDLEDAEVNAYVRSYHEGLVAFRSASYQLAFNADTLKL